MSSYQRIDRISEEVRREVDAIIREELGDPRISGTFSITRAEVTGDLRYAKIYVSVLEDDRRDELLEALKKNNIKATAEGIEKADWVLIDTFDVVVHLFRPEVREFYNLEKMWQVVSEKRK